MPSSIVEFSAACGCHFARAGYLVCFRISIVHVEIHPGDLGKMMVRKQKAANPKVRRLDGVINI
jgi:hypothetical protein